jgi:hypothetical protein
LHPENIQGPTLPPAALHRDQARHAIAVWTTEFHNARRRHSARYLDEGIAVLAARAPDLHKALERTAPSMITP